ncbi:MAG: DoxX family membrane protein [Firmicutes bacterium]|nr:DoxX family membrane protein [Bacillota bacterium]
MARRYTWRDGVDLVGAALRVWLGVQWFHAGIGKVGNPAWTGDHAGAAVTGFLKGALAKTAGEHPDVQPFYASFIQHFALPHAKLMSFLVAYGEVLVGIGLVLGALTTFALIAGALMNLNYMLAGTVSVNPMWFTVAVILLFIGTTGRFGVDGLWRYLRRRATPATEGGEPGTRVDKAAA